MTDPARILLGIEAHRIEVASSHAAVLVWLEEFLAPSFRRVASEPGVDPVRVRFEIAPDRHATLARDMGGAQLRTLDGFTLDGAFSRNPAWTAEDGREWAFEEDGAAFLLVEPGGRSVTVVVSHDESRPRIALMRVVRELATIALLRDGRLPLHASAFVLDGGAVLVCGAKRAGKTSLLVHALRCGADFLSNDRVFVDPGPSPVARAMPTIVMLRNGTLDLFGDLKRDFESARFDRGRTIAECAPGIERPEPVASAGHDRIGISPSQLCSLLGARMLPEAPVRAILFPYIDETGVGVELEPLKAADAARVLAENLLEPSSPARHSEVFAPGSVGDVIPPEHQAEHCRAVADQALAFACRLGPDAFDSDLLAPLRRARREIGPSARHKLSQKATSR